jgi:phage terminase large subunit-like protein
MMASLNPLSAPEPAQGRPDGRKELSPKAKEERRARLMLAGGKRLRKAVLRARKDPAAFIEFALRTPKGKKIKLEPFQREWLDKFKTSRRIQIEAAKSHGKTTNLIGYVLWQIGVNPDIRIKLFAQSQDKARERLNVIASMIQSNKLVRFVFPHLKPDKHGPWHKHAIQVERSITDKEPTVEASGIMGSVEGGRADLLVLDDVCDYRTSLIYPQHRQAIKNKVYAELLPMLEEDGRAISIATPHHELDAVASLRRNPQWESLVYAVGTDEDPFLPLWPSRWPREALKKLFEEVGPQEYDRAYRCKALSNAISIITGDHIQYYTFEMMPDPWQLICVQAYDVALTQKRKSSYFACVTLLYDPDKNWIFVADAWHDKMGFIEQAQAIIEQALKWQPNRIAIEETGYQGALRELLMELTEEPLPVFPMSPGSKSKELRLMETLPMFEGGRVWFNPRLDPQINLELGSRGDLVGQLLSFMSSADKDLGDAFAYGVRALRDYKNLEMDEDWRSGEGGVQTRLSIIGA